MNQVKKIYCRIFQKAFHLVIPILPYRQPKKVEHLADIPSILKEKGVDRILIVTDQGIRSHGLLEPLEKALRENHIFYEIYDKTVANPTTDNVEEARELYLSKECQALIGFGGGSSMDCAKGAGARIARPKKSLGQMAGILKVMKKLPLFIAVPTTAGTGSETTLAAVITDAKTRHKYAINDFPLIPDYAVLDPQITVSLPPNAVLLPYVLEAYGENIDAKLHCLAMAAGIADRETPAKQAAADFIQAVKDMKKRFGIGDKIKEIRREDIPKLARYADREANPLYPVPVLMDAKELELFYNKLLEE